MEAITRPALRYHGGKWKLAPWIISQFPQHRIYTESYGGAASVLIQKPRCYSEVYNDLDREVVNLFRVYRTHGKELIEQLRNTPFSREEFELSYEPTSDMVEQARRTVVRSFQGFGSSLTIKHKTGFRANSNRSGTTPAHDWANFPDAMSGLIERFRGVVIENRPAIDVMKQHDGPNTLHYVDPPYVLNTRYRKEKTKCYTYEMTDEEHLHLCEFLTTLAGTVVLSGYDTELYNDALTGWRKVQKRAFADGAAERIETLWINKTQNPGLFA
jgi:DNA adenine methylase